MDRSQDPYPSNSPHGGSSGNPGNSGDRRLGEIEQQLLQSTTYQTALNGLKEMFGDAGYAAQMLMHEVTREAIALALQRPVQAGDVSMAPPISQPISRQTSPSPRDRYLYRLGQYLRAQRCRQQISLVQLHHQTRIPISHLHALESGHISQYPQSPTYLRGTLHLWATALGLKAEAIVARIPSPPQPTPTRPPLPPRPPALSTPQPSPPTSAATWVYPWWWRSLACGMPLLATIALALGFANRPATSPPTEDVREPDLPNPGVRTPQRSEVDPFGGDRPEMIAPEPLLQRRD
ncbi:MAG: helix-turn-helix domain-containing protein [Phormidium sp.]